MVQLIQKSILIAAPVSTVWKFLTVPERMKQWMGDPEMELEIVSDWKIGSPFLVTGFHHSHFENQGNILQFEPGKVFQYSHLSSVSELPNEPGDYTVITFRLQESGSDQTQLTIEAENFPTEAIYKHWEFYWNGTVHLLKTQIEQTG